MAGLESVLQAIAMDEDAELAGLSDQVGPKAGVIPAGAMMATPGDQTNRKVPLDTAPSESKSMLGTTSREPAALLPASSGQHFRDVQKLQSTATALFNTQGSLLAVK